MQPIAQMDLEVERPINEVFDYLSDMKNFGDWFPGVVSIVSKDDVEHLGVGKIYLETIREPLKGEVTIPISVVAYQRNEVFQTQGAYPPLWPEMTVTLTKTGVQATRVEWKMESRNDTFVFRMTMLRLIRRIMRKRALIAKGRLKKILENRAAFRPAHSGT